MMNKKLNYQNTLQNKLISTINSNHFNQNDKFIQWLIGFLDAEGNFQTFPKVRVRKDGTIYYNIGYGFHLGLHSRDKELMNQIYSKLDYRGKIYEYSNKKEIHLAITKLEDLKWLIENILNTYPLLTKHQWDRYCKLKYGILEKFNRVENLQEYLDFADVNKSNFWVTPQFLNLDFYEYHNFINNWISGFITGEGSFIITSNGALRFSIEQVESNALEIIKKILNLNSSVLPTKQRENRKSTWNLSLQSKEDLKKLVDFFENKEVTPLLGYKLIQYKKWLELYSIKYNRE